jgi:hypothetical protein
MIGFLEWRPMDHHLPLKNFCNITNMPRPCFIDNMENRKHPLDFLSFRIGNYAILELHHCLHQWEIEQAITPSRNFHFSSPPSLSHMFRNKLI